MKKCLIAVYVLAMAYILAVPSVADASVDVPHSVIDSAIQKNYGYDNIVLFVDASGNYYLPIEKNANNEFVGPYDTNKYEELHWSVVKQSGRYELTTPSWWQMGIMKYDISTSTWSWYNQSIGSALNYNSNGWTIVYASKDVVFGYGTGELSGTIFFEVPLTPMTELAVIVEKSKPQTTLLQVISLLPLVIFLVVSFLGLRKCLQALRTILHGA